MDPFSGIREPIAAESARIEREISVRYQPYQLQALIDNFDRKKIRYDCEAIGDI